MAPSFPCCIGFMNREASIGARVRQIATESSSAAATVAANSRNSRPTTPPMKSSGMKAAIRERVIDTTVKPISLAPSSAAWRMLFPISRCRWMFSTTTMASSTMKPTATTSATRVRLLRLNPSAYMAAVAATSDTASTAPTMAVADTWRRNSPMMTITSPTVTARVISTSCCEARMVRVRSLSRPSSTLAGIWALSRGSASSTASAVATMLASGWRRITTSMPGLPFWVACTKSFSEPAATFATSRRSTGAPPRYATTSAP